MNIEEIAIKQLQDYCPKEGYYLAFSGGKDSCVVKHLLEKSGVPFESVYRVTKVSVDELSRDSKQIYNFGGAGKRNSLPETFKTVKKSLTTNLV